MQIVGLHHAQVTVPKNAVEQARAFYLGVLGLTEIEKPDILKPMGGFWVQIGAQQVHIGLQDGVNRTMLKAHIAYQVDDIDGWQKRIESSGLKVDDSDPIPGYRRFQFRDPFGNRVEMIQPIG